MNKLLVNLGWRKPADGNYVHALQFKTWKSWAALGLAIGVVAVLRQLWP